MRFKILAVTVLITVLAVSQFAAGAKTAGKKAVKSKPGADKAQTCTPHQFKYAFQDYRLPIADRMADLLKQMTFDEKISELGAEADAVTAGWNPQIRLRERGASRRLRTGQVHGFPDTDSDGRVVGPGHRAPRGDRYLGQGVGRDQPRDAERRLSSRALPFVLGAEHQHGPRPALGPHRKRTAKTRSSPDASQSHT